MKRTALFLTLSSLLFTQQPQMTFTRADTLRGTLSPARSCYDVTYYDLDVRIDTMKAPITGSNTIVFHVVNDFDVMQVDLFENMNVDSLVLDGTERATYTREFNAVFVKLPKEVKVGSMHSLQFFYSGTPQEATNPPWGGGFTWTHDKAGNPWIVVTCEGLGASVWWPTKDHPSDEPDSMAISITTRTGMDDVSNGRMRTKKDLGEGWTQFNWFVSYPINNYNVTFAIGKYSHFHDTHRSKDGDTLSLDYWVMQYDLARARTQFKQVKPMMQCFEDFFGKYAFYRDGYKLLQTPHLGMEHQSAVAYGNDYVQGYRGTASSPAGIKFDFIIIHESAHEWWGNAVSAADHADMWIHESFGAYAEAVYVECRWGYDEAMKYVNGKKPNVRNDRPIQGPYGVNKSGSGDMYDKGQLVLNTLRHAIGNDKLWWEIVLEIQNRFRYKAINADEIFSLVNEKTGRDWSSFFEQYFKKSSGPKLEVTVSKKADSTTIRYRWRAEVQGFAMPVKITDAKGKWITIVPTNMWQMMQVAKLDPAKFRVAEDQFYIETSIRRTYIDPNRK
jgi:aminopeptidase N